MAKKVRQVSPRSVARLPAHEPMRLIRGLSDAVVQGVALAWLGLLGDPQVSGPEAEGRAES